MRLVDVQIAVDDANKDRVCTMMPEFDHQKTLSVGCCWYCSLQSCAVQPVVADKAHKVLLHVISLHIHDNTHVTLSHNPMKACHVLWERLAH